MELRYRLLGYGRRTLSRAVARNAYIHDRQDAQGLAALRILQIYERRPGTLVALLMILLTEELIEHWKTKRVLNPNAVYTKGEPGSEP